MLYETKTGVVRILVIFLKIVICSAISFKRSLRELSADVAKIIKIRTTPDIVSFSKEVKYFPKRGPFITMTRVEK